MFEISGGWWANKGVRRCAIPIASLGIGATWPMAPSGHFRVHLFRSESPFPRFKLSHCAIGENIIV